MLGWLKFEWLFGKEDLLSCGSPFVLTWSSQPHNKHTYGPRRSITDIAPITNSVELSITREATSCAASHNFAAFHVTRRFITEFTWAFHLYLSWARTIQSNSPSPFSTKSIIMLSPHLRLGLPSGLFPSGFPAGIQSDISNLLRM
jgi:hypothetical protein